MKNEHNPHDLFGEISIDKPEITPNTPPGRKAKSPRKPHFSRQEVPPKAKVPFPVSLALTLFGMGAIAYLSCGFFVVPYLIKTFGAQAIARHLGRPITIGQAKFNPIRFQVTLINGIVGPLLSNSTDKVDPILSFARMTLNLETISLLRRALILQELSIDQPFFHLVHNTDSQFNLTTLIQPPVTKSPHPLLWILSKAAGRYSINNIRLTKGEVRYDDIPTNKTHRLEEISLTLPTIENINYHSGGLQPNFSARVNGTPISMAGQTTVSQQEPTTASMNLKMTNLDLKAYRDYLPPSLDMQSLGGQADLDLDVLYDGSRSDKLRLVGVIALREFQGETAQGQLNIDSGRIKGWFAPLSKQFHADAITLDHPVWRRPADKKFPWKSLASTLIQTDPRQRGTMPVTLLQITNGEILSPPVSATEPNSDWKSIDASINTAQTPDNPEQAFFSINTRTDTGSRLSIQGSAGSAPFTAKGLIIANTIDIAALQDLWETIGPPLPVTGGTIDQAQANFDVTLDSEQRPILEFAPVAIQARNIQAELNGQTLVVPVWQSEQGAFNLNDPTLHLGKVRIQQAKLTCLRSSADVSWQSPFTGPAGQAALPPRIDLKGLELTNGSLVVENQGPPDITLRLERFDLQVEQIDRNQPNPLSAAAMLDDKYPVQLAGTFSLSPFNATLNLQAADVPLAVFQPLIDHYFAISATGLLNADGVLSLPALDFTGAWSITELAAPPISCRKIDGEKTDIQLRPLAVSIDKLNLAGPSLQISASETGMPQLPTLIHPGWQPAPSLDKATVSIKTISINEGNLIYDFPGPPGITITNNNITGDLSDFIVVKDQRIPFNFSGKIENTADFAVEGTIRPFASQPAMTLASQIEGLPLSSLAAVIEPYWGYTVKDGTLDFENDMTFENTLIHDKGHLTLKGVALGKPLAGPSIKAIGSTWETLPLIQALLQDADGTIALTIPVDGRTDTGFTYLEGMKTYLNQLLLKATVSPLSVLGNDQKTIPETIDFDPGSDQLGPTMKERLTPLAVFLSEHPMVSVTLVGSTDLADQKSLLRLNKETSQGPVPRESLQKLATLRTQSVSDFLTKNGAPASQVSRSVAETSPSEISGKTSRQVAINVSVIK